MHIERHRMLSSGCSSAVASNWQGVALAALFIVAGWAEGRPTPLRAALAAPAGMLRACQQAAATLPASRPALTAGTLIPAADLRDDIRVLRDAYETLHPGLYRYASRSDVDASFAQLSVELDGDRSLRETYLALSRFLAKVRCGHTFANPANQRKAVAAALFEQGKKLPCFFRWLADGSGGWQMVVTRDLTGEGSLPAGSRIVSINGVSAGRVLRDLLPLARADGGNDAKRRAGMEVQGIDRQDAFDILFPLLYGPAERFELEVEAVDGTAARVSTPGLTSAQRQTAAEANRVRAAGREGVTAEALDPADEGAKEFGWQFETAAPGIVLARMPTWAVYDAKWDWKAYLNRRLDALIAANATALIVDLRGNEGGSDVGDVILARMAKAPVSRGTYRQYTRYRLVPAALRPYLDTWDPSFLDWGEAASPVGNGFFRMTKFEDEQPVEVGATRDGAGRVLPDRPRFVGKLVVLTDATNSSATGQFAQAVKESKAGTLIGQTTGGNQRGINGSAFFFLRLPHSKIEMDLPVVGLFPEATDLPDGSAGRPAPFARWPDGGVEPDMSVIPTRADLAAGRDCELEAAVAFCNRP